MRINLPHSWGGPVEDRDGVIVILERVSLEAKDLLIKQALRPFPFVVSEGVSPIGHR